MKTLFILTLFFVSGNLLFAQDDTKDEIERIVVKGTSESYMQFVPKEYDPNQLWPALFVFDPSANGQGGIQSFILAAKEFGYIVVASNNSRNGQHQANFEIASRMMNQLLQSYSVDAKRMYVAGFSGGSRLASAIAVLSKQMQGVIACGSGFSPNSAEQPSFEEFSYAGIVGTSDMNYAEMHTAHAWLDKFDVNNRLFVFDGDHQWPSAETMIRAFIWLELQAAQKGLVKINANRKNMLLKKDLAYAEGLIDSEDTLMAYKDLKSIIKGGSPPQQRMKVNEVISELTQDPVLLENYSLESALLKEENKQLNEISQRYLKDLEKPGKSAMKWWNKRIAGLKADENSKGELERMQAVRLQKHIRAIAFETGFVDQSHKDSYEKALFSTKLCLLVDPENTYYNYLLVYTHATHGKTDLALEALEEAFQQQKLDPEKFKTYKLHKRLEGNQRYQDLLANYNKSD